MHEYRTTRKIEFSDTDLAGVVHFARFFIYMETAEDEFLRQLGAGFTMNDRGRSLGWPKISVACDYRSPARYGDTLDIHLSVDSIGRTTITYAIVFTRGDTEIARGRTTSACVEMKADGTFSSSPIPATLAARIEPAPR